MKRLAYCTNALFITVQSWGVLLAKTPSALESGVFAASFGGFENGYMTGLDYIRAVTGLPPAPADNEGSSCSIS